VSQQFGIAKMRGIQAYAIDGAQITGMVWPNQKPHDLSPQRISNYKTIRCTFFDLMCTILRCPLRHRKKVHVQAENM
jgi:hypothetical protein